MKTKNLSTALLLITTIILLISCEKESTPDININAEETISVKKPAQMISLNEAHELYKAYQDNFMSKSNTDKMAYYGWHSIEFYKNYIAYTEQEAAKNDIKVTGLRLYFVAYPEDKATYGERAGYQTYMFLPTYFDASSNAHRPFDPSLINEKKQPIAIEGIIKQGTEKYKRATWHQKTNQLTAAANMGQMCPINCPEEEDDNLIGN